MRLLESRRVKGQAGREYTMNLYPADMIFNDFIPGVFVLMTDGPDSKSVYIGESDNVDLWLRTNDVMVRLRAEGFARIGLIRNGSRSVREAIVADLQGTFATGVSDSLS